MIRAARGQLILREGSGGDRHRPHAEVLAAGDVVWRIADDDDRLPLESLPDRLFRPVHGDQRERPPVVVIGAERAELPLLERRARVVLVIFGSAIGITQLALILMGWSHWRRGPS